MKEEEEKAVITRLPMICDCSDEGHEEAAGLMAQAREILGEGVTDANFLTRVVIWLNWDHSAEIKYIANDMWSAVCAEYWKGPRKGEAVRVECDMIEHGLAAIVVWFDQQGWSGRGIGKEAGDVPDA